MRKRNIVSLAILIALLSIAITLLLQYTIPQTPQYEPVPIPSTAMCSYCSMLVTDERFSAEIIFRNGTARFFDDIGCMIMYLSGLKGEDQGLIAAIYVHDFYKAKWLRVNDAYFAFGTDIATPMRFGVIALDRDSIDRFMQEHTFKEIIPPGMFNITEFRLKLRS